MHSQHVTMLLVSSYLTFSPFQAWLNSLTCLLCAVSILLKG